MRDGDGEADGEGGRPQAAIPPLVGDGEDAHHKLHGEEDLHGGGHPQADAGLQLEEQREEKNQTVPRANPELRLASDQSTKQLPLWVFTVFIDRFPLMLPGVTPYSTAAPATAPRH